MLLAVSVCSPALAVEFELTTVVPVYEVPGEFDGLPRFEQPNFSELAWVSPTELIFFEPPLVMMLDVPAREFTRMAGVEESLLSTRAQGGNLRNANGLIVSDAPRPGERLYRVVTTTENRVVRSDAWNALVFGIFDHGEPSTRNTLGIWGLPLYGGYTVRPQVTQAEGPPSPLVIHAPDGSERLISDEFEKFDVVHQLFPIALDVTRFRLAVFALWVESEIHGNDRGNKVWIFDIVYDGQAERIAVVRADPNDAGAATTQLEAGTSLTVVAAENYGTRNGGEDYWYQVETEEGTTGWVHGTDLLIEGGDWKDRLADRGAPLSMEQIVERYGVDEE